MKKLITDQLLNPNALLRRAAWQSDVDVMGTQRGLQNIQDVYNLIRNGW
jgi:hypothetical protein